MAFPNCHLLTVFLLGDNVPLNSLERASSDWRSEMDGRQQQLMKIKTNVRDRKRGSLLRYLSTMIFMAGSS